MSRTPHCILVSNETYYSVKIDLLQCAVTLLLTLALCPGLGLRVEGLGVGDEVLGVRA